MAEKVSPVKKTYLSSLNESEKKEVDEKVKYELYLTNYSTLKKMTFVGAITNVLTGIFLIWVFYGQINHKILYGWYAALVFFNVVNVGWSTLGYKHSEITTSMLQKWYKGLCFILAGLCLTWGSIGILFFSENPFYQLFVISFLYVAVLGFTVSSIFDFFLAVICISCLLVPTTIYQFYLAVINTNVLGHNNSLNVAFGISFLILGLFLLVVSYIGYKLTISQALLSYLNQALNQKLDSMNQFLEQRVKERTIELRKSLQLVTYQATHDLLTDLPNQRLLLEYLQKAIDECNRNNHVFSVIFFSINELESINDGLGHEAGDLVVKTIAQRFKKYLSDISNYSKVPRYIVTLTRKDTFVIILDRIFNLEDIDPKVEILFTILDEPIITEKQAVKVTASIGMTLFPRDGSDIQSLLMNSDAAMLSAKQRGGNSINKYKAEINADISRRLELESSLHEAIKNNEFMLQYQPFIELKTGKIRGMEALVRWNHPTLGFVPPLHFISLAEKNGVIAPLGEWVMRAACAQLKAWQDQGFTSLKMSINLSSKQFLDKNILQTIDNIIDETKVKPEDIEFELTESEAFQDEVIPMLRQLKSLGFGLSIDDFGTGYSGLSNLKLFTIDVLKIDKSFINDVGTNIHSRAIVSNIINLAKKLQVTVLAEGVETREQLDFLIEQGCDLIQGYYFRPPVDTDVFTKLLQEKTTFDV